MNIVAVTLVEVMLVYAIPLALLIVIWLLLSFVVFAIARWTRRPLAEDINARIARKRGNRSGRALRLTLAHVALSVAGDNCFQATLFYRASSWLVQHRMGALGRSVHAFAKFVTHADISPRAAIGPGLYLYHGLGTVIGKGSTVGRHALICQNVTLGGGARVGDDVKLWAGAKVIGQVTVGDRSEIGANGVVVGDVPSDVVAVGVPATRFLPKRLPSDTQPQTAAERARR
jgi:serine O-acetyltransferase